MLSELSKILFIIGIVIILIAALVWLFAKTPLGHLPGDIVIRKKNFVFYFPIMTSILLSIILTLILTFIFRRGQ